MHAIFTSDFFHHLTHLAEVLLVYNQRHLEGYLVTCFLFPFLFHDIPVGKNEQKTPPNPTQNMLNCTPTLLADQLCFLLHGESKDYWKRVF